MIDNDELLRAYGRISRMECRRRLDNEIGAVKAAQKAGLLVRRATIAGVPMEFGAPELAKAGAEEPPRVAMFRNPKQKLVL